MMDIFAIGSYAARVRAFIAACAAGTCPQPEANPTFNELARELFSLQFHGNKSYRLFCQARAVTPATVGDWTHIPAVPTSAFKHYDLTLLSETERTTAFYSSGTTAQQSRHFHNPLTLELYEASLLAWFRLRMPGLGAGKGEKKRFILLTPEPAQVPHSSLVHMLGKVAAIHASPVWTGHADAQGGWILDLQATFRALDTACRAKEPVWILGTAFSFVHLLDYASEHRLDWQLPADSVIMETGGYKGRSRTMPKLELHREISRRLGVSSRQIICEYGMCELSSQAYDTGWPEVHRDTFIPASTLPARRSEPPVNRPFHFPPWARVRIVSPETGKTASEGETGLIQVFDLANAGSAMAVQTEDLGEMDGEGFRLLGRAPESETRGCSLMAV